MHDRRRHLTEQHEAVEDLLEVVHAPSIIDPLALAAGAGVGIASSVIPYVCDQLAMARLARSSYALLTRCCPPRRP